MAPIFDTERLQPEGLGLERFPTSLGERLGAEASETLESLPVPNIFRSTELASAKLGYEGGLFGYSSGTPTPDVPMEEARAKVKAAGLDQHLKLPDDPSIKAPALDIMMERANKRREREATIARGPTGFIPGALSFGTGFFLPLIDPLNDAAFMIPAVGEARGAAWLAGAGDSLMSRTGVRFGIGATQGAVGTAALQPLEAWAKTQEGQDFTAAEAVRNVMMGSGLAGTLHGSFGLVGDAWRRATGQPLKGLPPRETRVQPPAAEPGEPVPAIPAEEPSTIAQAATLAQPESVTASTELPKTAPTEPSLPAAIVQSLPPAAHRDAMQGALANLIDGEPVQAAEHLEAAGRQDSRIADGLATIDAAAQPSAERERAGIAMQVAADLTMAGRPPPEANRIAAAVADRYVARAEALGGRAGTPGEMFGRAGIEVKRGGESAEQGRSFEQFAGERAATADHGALAEAKRLDAAGTKPDEIWRQTGWYKRPDGWRFEIDDSKTDFKPDALAERKSRYGDDIEYGFRGRLGDLIDAPGLFKAYPDLAGVDVTIGRPSSWTSTGGVDPNTRAISISGEGSKHDIRSTLLHEVQHAIQLAEGFDRGGNAGTLLARTETALFDLTHQIAALRPGSNMRAELEGLRMSLRKQAEKLSGGVPDFSVTNVQHDAYERLLGEVEARNTQFRQSMTAAQRRESFPGSTEDVPAAEQYRGADLVRLEPKNAALIAAAVKREWDDSIQNVANFDGSVQPDSISLSPQYGGENNPKPIAGGRSNIHPSLKFTPEDVARVIKEYGAKALSDTLADHIAYRQNGPMHEGERLRPPSGPPSEQLQNIRRLKAVIDRIITKHPELGPLGERPNLAALSPEERNRLAYFDDHAPRTPDEFSEYGNLVRKAGARVRSYEVRAADREGLIESYAGRKFTEEQRDAYRRQISGAIDKMGDAGELTPDEAYGLSYDFHAQGLDHQWGVDRMHPEAFAKLYAKHKDLIDEYRAARDYVAYEHNKASAGLSMSRGFAQKSAAGEPQGRVTFANNKRIIELFKSADASTGMHEFGHIWLEEMMEDAARSDAPDWLRADRDTVREWLGAQGDAPLTTEQHEQFARGFEQYLREGRSPSRLLAAVFAKFREWFMAIYRKASELGVPIGEEMRGVYDRMLATREDIAKYAGDRPARPGEDPKAALAGDWQALASGRGRGDADAIARDAEAVKEPESVKADAATLEAPKAGGTEAPAKDMTPSRAPVPKGDYIRRVAEGEESLPTSGELSDAVHRLRVFDHQLLIDAGLTDAEAKRFRQLDRIIDGGGREADEAIAEKEEFYKRFPEDEPEPDIEDIDSLRQLRTEFDNLERHGDETTEEFQDGMARVLKRYVLAFQDRDPFAVAVFRKAAFEAQSAGISTEALTNDVLKRVLGDLSLSDQEFVRSLFKQKAPLTEPPATGTELPAAASTAPTSLAARPQSPATKAALAAEERGASDYAARGGDDTWRLMTGKTLGDALAAIDRDQSELSTIIDRGAACLAAAMGA